MVVRIKSEFPKNMVARILADTRYLGDSGFPVLIDAAVFLDAEEKRKKKPRQYRKRMHRRCCGENVGAGLHRISNTRFCIY